MGDFVGSDELIELRYNNTNSGFNRLLTFGREPSTCENNEIDELINDLTNDDWHVILLETNESETACDYVEYSFNFIAKGTSGIVQAVSSTGIVDGVWAVSSGDSGLELNLTFDITGQNDPFEDLNEDWDVIISTLIKFSFKYLIIMEMGGIRFYSSRSSHWLREYLACDHRGQVDP